MAIWALAVALGCGAAPVLAQGSESPGAAAPAAETDPAVLRWLPPGYPVARRQVDARELPWRAIGRINTYGGQHYCTGTLIGETLALTAAHCVWRLREHPGQINFLAGFQRNHYAAHAKAARLHFAPGYRGPETAPTTFAADWAAIELNQPIGRDTGFLRWSRFDAATFERVGGTSRAFAISGYRGDRAFVQTVDQGCRIGGFRADLALMEHNCPLMYGDSGGPVLLKRGDRDAEGGAYLLVGIDVAGLVDPASVIPTLRNPPRMKQGFAVPTHHFADLLEALGSQPLAIDAMAEAAAP